MKKNKTTTKRLKKSKGDDRLASSSASNYKKYNATALTFKIICAQIPVNRTLSNVGIGRDDDGIIVWFENKWPFFLKRCCVLGECRVCCCWPVAVVNSRASSIWALSQMASPSVVVRLHGSGGGVGGQPFSTCLNLARLRVLLHLFSSLLFSVFVRCNLFSTRC